MTTPRTSTTRSISFGPGDGKVTVSLLEKLHRLDERVLPRLARGLRRIRELPRPRALVVISALLVLAVVATIAWEADGPTVEADGIGDSIRVGPQDGASIPAYVQASREELGRLSAAAPAPAKLMYALVTLAIYASPESVATLFRPHLDLTTWIAFARVPLPRRQTQRVQIAAERLPADLIAAMTQVADKKSVEAAHYTELAQSESSVDRRVLHESLATLASAEASAYRQPCACIFAVVVRGTPAALAALAGSAYVRAVDPAPEVIELDRAVFFAPLPEQIDRVRPPIDDDAPVPQELATPSSR